MLQLTPRGIGGIAALLLAGEEARALVVRLAGSPRACQLKPGEVLYTPLLDRAAAEPVLLDDAVVVCRGESASGAEEFELHLHGGIAVIDAVKAALRELGAQELTPDQAFDQGVFGRGLEGEITTTLGRAQTMTAVQLLAGQREAGLTTWGRQWLGKCETMCGPGSLWRLHAATQWLLERSRTLMHLLNTPRIAIIGPPNAGKSTLANALLGRPVSITSDIPGTTRDWVDAQAVFTAGHADLDAPFPRNVQLAVTLIDTAGIRQTPDALEQESILRTHSQAAAADVIIVLLDATRPLDGEQRDLLVQFAKTPKVIAFNKTDLARSPNEIPNALAISAARRVGLEALMEAVLQRLDLHAIDPAEPFLFTDRQRDIAEELASTTSVGPARFQLGQLLNCIIGR